MTASIPLAPHDSLVSVAEVSTNWIIGVVPPYGQADPSKARLFDSPVNPSSSATGALVVPLFTLVWTITEVPLPRLTSFMQQLPKTLNSAAVQAFSRPST